MRIALRQTLSTDVIKWIASALQIFGYGATAMEATPLNLYFFSAGIVGWFIVGLHWNDRAIMLIHVVAAAAMVVGLLA
ncbi:DUF6552 family protein [uncultured Tateyamaria sp.]|uniref:DUF6552 family protein n=1 Tax=uncultured Tateyamaria sp. TaxID=455651 RepID=UPI00261FD953|nr:DUF6552 family protein [uncultured Tateyamaria sp.]